MEFLLSLLFEGILPVLFEGLAQLGLELGAAMLFETDRPLLSLVGHGLLGGLMGGLSLWVFPEHLLADPFLIDLNLLVAPVIAAGLSAAVAGLLGRPWLWALGNGFVFVFAFALLRWMHAA